MPSEHRILIIDDDGDLLSAYERILSREGYEVSVAATARDAMKAIAEGSWGVVILDLRLQGPDGGDGGLRVLKDIRQESPGSRTIVISREDGGSGVHDAASAEMRFTRFFNNTPMAIASVSARLSPIGPATDRATWATSSAWVRRVRWWSSGKTNTWVLPASRRNAVECRMRSRSRSKQVRYGSGASSANREPASNACVACGARCSRSCASRRARSAVWVVPGPAHESA